LFFIHILFSFIHLTLFLLFTGFHLQRRDYHDNDNDDDGHHHHHHHSTPNRRHEQLLVGWKRGATRQVDNATGQGRRGGRTITTRAATVKTMTATKSTVMRETKKGPRDVGVSWATGKFFFPSFSLLLTKMILGSDFAIDDDDWRPLTHPHPHHCHEPLLVGWLGGSNTIRPR
jgi:hypothetical protein